MDRTSTTVAGLFIGRAERIWPDRPPSAIRKVRADGPMDLTITGFTGDEQADLRVHGGPEKAVMQYPLQHYAVWKDEMGASEPGLRAGGFGENISAAGFDEQTVCIGDRFRIGTAFVQVTQGRTPCWKLNRHTGIARMAAEFVRTGRTGWYYRVLEPGWVGQGDTISLVERHNPDWTVARVTNARLTSRLDTALAREIVSIPGLSENWQRSFGRKADAGYRDDPEAAWRDG
ncbi:MOSC domain-containing protein [Haliangium sp.]